MRVISSSTRIKLESIIRRIANGSEISLSERIALQKYSSRKPFIASKLNQALIQRESLDNDGIIR